MESKNFDYKKLNTILQNKNISVEQLAKMTGKTPRAVRPWLNGTSTPHKSSLKKIIEVLHISEESISKTGSSIRNKEYEVITESLDFLFDYYLPLFAYYTRNNEGYQLNKNIEKLNKLNSIHSDSIRYRSNKELYKNKTSLDCSLDSIISEIKEYVQKNDFPLEEMKEISKNMIYEIAETSVRKKCRNFDKYELYRSTCLESIITIDNIFKSSSTLLRMLGEKTILNYSDELLKEKPTLSAKHEIDSHMGIVVNIFSSNIRLMKDIFIHELERFSYFSAYYLFLYEQSILDPNFIDFPIPSKEFLIYLNWKIYKNDNDKFAKSILDSLEEKIQDNFDFLSTHSSYIKEMLDDVVPLVKDDARLACISYLKKNKKDYSLPLLSLLEDLPIQWTKRE